MKETSSTVIVKAIVLSSFIVISAIAIFLISGGKSKDSVKHVEQDFSGGKIVMELKVGSSFSAKIKSFLFFSYTVTPQFAIWTEDLDGNYVETLYVTEKTAEGNFTGAKDGRKEALPYWSHKSGNANFSSGATAAPKPDVVSGATPSSDIELLLGLKEKHDRFRLMFEINRSYDYNDYYTENSNPGDVGYNTGYSGQPAIVYSVVIDMNDANTSYSLKPVGHSSPTGEDGRLEKDLSNMTTALEILSSVNAMVMTAD